VLAPASESVLPDPSKDCYAYAAAYSNPCDPNAQSYITAMGGADGASMVTLADGTHYNANAYGGTAISGSTNYDQIGSYYNRGYSLFSTTDAHVVTITQFTVSDKMNLFFGGTHQIITNVSVMNPSSGSIVSGGNYMSSGSVITWIKW
jgi:hypothetical protein